MNKRSSLLLFLFLGFVIVYESGGSAPPDPNAWRSHTHPSMAYSISEKWVTPKLKAPATATFPDHGEIKREEHVTYLGNRTYRVRSWVDSQNAFGAFIRTKWETVVQQTDEHQWVLQSMTFK